VSVPSACPHCQKPLPDGYIGKACPHCRGALGNKRKRSLSGFSFQAMQPTMAGSSRPPHSPHSSAPPREVVEDRWDLPDHGAEAPRERGAVPPAAPTGFPAVPSPMTAKGLRSTMALGGQSPSADAPAPAPVASPTRSSGPDPIRTTALLDPFAWNLDHAQTPAAPPARSSVLDVRTLRQTALGVGAQALPSPPPPAPSAVTGPSLAALRSTALGIGAMPAAPAAPADFEDADDVFEADAFPLVRSTQPSGTTVSTRPPPALDSVDGMHEEIEIPSAPAPDFELGAHYADLENSDPRPSQMPAYSPLRAPPSLRPAPATPVAWAWSIGGAALVLSAVVALRSAPLAVALRAAAGAASLLMLARFGGLSMRALLLLLVALPALAQEALSIASLSRAGAAMLTGALVLLPAGAWISSGRALVRRSLLLAGVVLTVAAMLMPGGVARPWSFGALPALVLALVAMATPARQVSAALTVALMAWAAACSASAGGPTLPAVATGLATAALVLLCGRALAAVVESDEG
jgi:hypothetical protein